MKKAKYSPQEVHLENLAFSKKYAKLVEYFQLKVLISREDIRPNHEMMNGNPNFVGDESYS